MQLKKVDIDYICKLKNISKYQKIILIYLNINVYYDTTEHVFLKLWGVG